MYWAQLAVAGVFAGAVYALFGQGITLVYKSTRVPNFAHGAVGTVGAFLFYKAWGAARHQLQVPFLHFQLPFTKLAWNPVLPKMPLALALLLALAVTALLGLAIERL
ncbi:MAG: hypothetical protein JOY57_05385, partial [Actinobacteria bacterium]|nr:hypothetical protein [Actinomycetota bacterium]